MSNQIRFNLIVFAFCFSIVFLFVWRFEGENLNTMVSHPKVKTLGIGAQIAGANGLGFDAENHMYVGSVGGRGIFVLDADNGQILDYLGPEQGVEGADDLVFGPDGALYYTAILTGEVGRIAPDWTKSTVANLPLGVNPITFSDDGRLFVALDFLGDALYEIYLNGSPPRLIASNLGWFNGSDWGPDNQLYGPLIQKGEIVKVDVDSGAITTVARGFRTPTAVKFSPDGALYLVDSYQVIRLDIQTRKKVVIAELEHGLDNLAFDHKGRLFVTNNDLGSVYEVLPDGQNRQVVAGGMISPAGVAVLPGKNQSDHVFVANVFPLHEIDGKTGERLSLEQNIGSVMTVSDDDDRLVLSSWFSNAVQVYNPESHTILEAYNDFAAPLNAIRFQTDLVVAELGSGQVVRRDSETGQRTMLAQLQVPAGLAAAGDNLYAGDWATGTVWQIIADGKPVSVPIASGLDHPEGLAVCSNGDLLVVEAGAGRLSRIKVKTGGVNLVADGLELGRQGPSTMPPTWVFNGVAVGRSGYAYVTSDIMNRIYRIQIGK